MLWEANRWYRQKVIVLGYQGKDPFVLTVPPLTLVRWCKSTGLRIEYDSVEPARLRAC